MSAHYLYPARPWMLRPRSTVVRATGILAGRLGMVEDVKADALVVLRWDGGDRVAIGWDVASKLLAIDLRDVTARAHAAMAYTVVRSLGSYGREPSATWSVVTTHALAYRPTVADTLTRMRMMDESVTVEDARVALDLALLDACEKHKADT